MKITLTNQLRVSALLLMVMAYPAMASNAPHPLGSDNRIEVVAYDADNVVPVKLNLMTATEFVLNPDEHVIDFQTGDSSVWKFDNKNEPPYMFFLSPKIAGSNTNATVVTDKRMYYFHLYSSSDTNANHTTYAVRFIYPEEEKARMLAEQAATLNLSKDPSAYNWHYSYSGDRSILPLHIFDDGKFTYLQLRPGQSIPAIFAVDNAKGEESVVNFRQQGDYLVITRIAPQFTLRNGNYAVVSVFNDDLTKKLWNGGQF